LIFSLLYAISPITSAQFSFDNTELSQNITTPNLAAPSPLPPPVDFYPASLLPTNINPLIATSDLNADGKQDLAAVTKDGLTISGFWVMVTAVFNPELRCFLYNKRDALSPSLSSKRPSPSTNSVILSRSTVDRKRSRGGVMIKVSKKEDIRRAYYVEQKSLRQIAAQFKCCRRTIHKALACAEAEHYIRKVPPAAPVLGQYKVRLEQLWRENADLPTKQRLTGKQIYRQLQKEGYSGSEARVQSYLVELRKQTKIVPTFLPLEFDPGQDAQVDWGEAQVEMAGQPLIVQFFVMRLNYSRRIFVRAYPRQKQEAFFEAHTLAFEFFGGVPARLTYDNLANAVKEVLTGKNRVEQESFIVFRSHYLFESNFCTPGEGHEKGGVESGVGYARRNFLSPPPKVCSFEELNRQLLALCEAEDGRKVDRQPLSIGEAFTQEKPLLRKLPAYAYRCCVTLCVTLNPYSQVRYETNRYSLPADKAKKQLVLRAYPFTVEILDGEEVLARHPRSYAREQDILDPLHYLPLLERRPGAFEYAKPMRVWRKQWPQSYSQLLAELQAKWPDGRGVREFVAILLLHRQHSTELVEQAITLALGYGCSHLDGVKLCLAQLAEPAALPPPLRPERYTGLVQLEAQALDLKMYEQLLLQGFEPPQERERGEPNYAQSRKSVTGGKLSQATALASRIGPVPEVGVGCGQ
jgi:transposase